MWLFAVTTLPNKRGITDQAVYQWEGSSPSTRHGSDLLHIASPVAGLFARKSTHATLMQLAVPLRGGDGEAMLQNKDEVEARGRLSPKAGVSEPWMPHAAKRRSNASPLCTH